MSSGDHQAAWLELSMGYGTSVTAAGAANAGTAMRVAAMAVAATRAVFRNVTFLGRSGAVQCLQERGEAALAGDGATHAEGPRARGEEVPGVSRVDAAGGHEPGLR